MEWEEYDSLCDFIGLVCGSTTLDDPDELKEVEEDDPRDQLDGTVASSTANSDGSHSQKKTIRQTKFAKRAIDLPPRLWLALRRGGQRPRTLYTPRWAT